MTSTVHTRRVGKVLVVEINRPEVRNAVDGPTATALAKAFRDFDADDSLHVAVLTGAGGNFCAGADLKAMSTRSPNSNKLNPDMNDDAPMGPTRMMLSKPVIASIEGFAVAGGMELACWCDLRVVSEYATFGIYCRLRGVPLIDGGTFRLAQIVGRGVALDWMLTGRAVTAREASLHGLANRIVPDGESTFEAALNLAKEIAAHPQTCLRNDRTSFLESLGEKKMLETEFKYGMQTLKAGSHLEGSTKFVDQQKSKL
ncbi:enoyl-CoA hydratase/isomerase [Cladochytrium replicatum]|nr:enoyl-CoA hydratase/isomerase [Cladochytrium replicatum]